MAELTKCTSCHKPIRMCRTEKGRLMPVDPDPVGQSVGLERTGNARLTLQDGLHGFEVRVLKDAEPWDGPLYVSHFATCPEARRWSNRKDLRKAADDAIERVRDLGRR